MHQRYGRAPRSLLTEHLRMPSVIEILFMLALVLVMLNVASTKATEGNFSSGSVKP